MSEPVGNSPRIGLPGGAGSVQGNSHKERAEQKADAEPREEVGKIIEGKVVTRKPALWKRAARSMLAEDANDIGGFVLIEVIVPAAKNLIRDIIVGGTDRALYGSLRRGNNGPRFGLSGNVGGIRTKYDQMSSEPRRLMSRDARERHDFQEVRLDTRGEAVEVIEALIELVGRYGSARVSDLYSLVGVTGSYADQRWGWYSLAEADIRQSRGGWLLDLPQPEPLR